MKPVFFETHNFLAWADKLARQTLGHLVVVLARQSASIFVFQFVPQRIMDLAIVCP